MGARRRSLRELVNGRPIPANEREFLGTRPPFEPLLGRDRLIDVNERLGIDQRDGTSRERVRRWRDSQRMFGEPTVEV